MNAPEHTIGSSAAIIRKNKLRRLSLAVLGLTAVTIQAQAANPTWTGTGPTGNWTDTTWSPAGVPGASSGTSSTDSATFTSAGVDTITVDATRNIQTITFNGTSAYTLTGGSLVLTAAGTIVNNSSSTSVQTINSTVSLNGTYSFDSSATSATNTLSFGGGISQASTGTLTLKGTNTGLNTISGALANGAGTLAIIKSGAGTWVLSGANTYTGATVVNGGTLSLTGSLTGTSISTTTGGISETSGGVIAGGGSVTVNGGSSTLLGANTYSGGTIVATTGTLTFNSLSDSGTSALGNSGQLGVQSGGTVIYNGAAAGSTTRVVAFGNSGGTGGAFGTIENDSSSTSATLSFGKFSSAGTNNSSTTDIRLQGTNTGVNILTGASAVLANGTNGNIVTMTKAQGGTWEISGANTYGGKTSVTGGTLMIGNATALGFGGLGTTDQGTTVSSGAVLDLNGVSNVNETITLNGTGIGGAGALINSNATAATIKAGAVSALTLTSAGSGLSKTAPTVTISGGGGSSAAATALLGLTSSSYSITSGGTGYASAPTITVTGAGAGAKIVATLGTGATAGQIVALTLTGSGAGTGTTVFTITGGGGSGAVITPVDNTYFISGLTVTNAGTGYTSTPTVTLSTSTGTAATASANLAGVVLASSSSIGGTGNITLNNPVSESGGSYGLTKVGTNTATLTAANTYSGGTTVSGGTLGLSGSGTLGGTAGSLQNDATLDLGGTSQSVGAFTGASSGSVSNSLAASTSTLTVGTSNTSGSYAGTISNGSGTVALAKNGTGTQTLTNGGNTYSGGTAVSAGTLLLTNSSGTSATGAGALTVSGTATLAGTGTSSGSSFSIQGTDSTNRTTVLVGQISTSDTNVASTLTVKGSGASTIGNTNLLYNLNAAAVGGSGKDGTLNVGTSGNELVVGGTAVNFLNNVNLTLNLQNNSTIIAGGTPFVLIAGNGGGSTAATSQFTGLTFGLSTGTYGTTGLTTYITGITGGSLTLTFDLADATHYANSYLALYQNTGIDYIEVVVVPEPGTWAMMFAGLVGLVFLQRRNTKGRR